MALARLSTILRSCYFYILKFTLVKKKGRVVVFLSTVQLASFLVKNDEVHK